ncbi:MAG: hypothetical protein ACRDRK_15390 [Pseudonocardia sp.]
MVARRAISARDPAALSEPLVGKWSPTSYWGYWFGLRNQAADPVPFRDPMTCPTTSAPVLIGGVSAPDTGGARVRAMCTPGGAALTVEPTNPAGADGRLPTGSYTGTVDFLPDDNDKGAVELTVLRTDWWPLPTSTLLAGILLALGVTWQTGRLSRLSELTEQTYRLEDAATTAEVDFRRRSAGRAWSGTSMAGISERADGLRASVRGQRRSMGALAKDDPALLSIEVDIAGTRRIVDEWPLLHDRLIVLQQGIDAVRAAGAPPALITGAVALTTSSTVPLAKVDDRIAAVLATTRLVRAWAVDDAVLDGAEHDVKTITLNQAEFPRMPDEDRQFADAKAAIGRARIGLAAVTSLAEYDERGIAEDARTARRLLDGLSHLRPSAHVGGLGGDDGPGSGPAPGTAPDDDSPAVHAARIRRRRRAVNAIQGRTRRPASIDEPPLRRIPRDRLSCHARCPRELVTELLPTDPRRTRPPRLPDRCLHGSGAWAARSLYGDVRRCRAWSTICGGGRRTPSTSGDAVTATRGRGILRWRGRWKQRWIRGGSCMTRIRRVVVVRCGWSGTRRAQVS